MGDVTMLSRAIDATPAIPADELQSYGDELVTRARVEALDAIRASLLTEFVAKGRSVKPQDLKRWRYQAREAAKAWQAVVATTTELLNEIEKQSAPAIPGEGETDA